MLQLETVPLLGLVLQKAKNCNSCVFDVKCALFHCYISFSVCFLCWIEDILFFEEWICFLFFFHLLSSIAMRDIVTLQVHIFVVFFFMDIWHLSNWPNINVLYLSIGKLCLATFLNVIDYISISHFLKEIFILFIVFTHW